MGVEEWRSRNCERFPEIGTGSQIENLIRRLFRLKTFFNDKF